MAHRAADLRATAQLATAATAGVTDIVEGVHLSVLQTIGLARGRGVGTTRGVTGLVYRGVRGITRLVASAIDGALAAVEANVTADATRGDGSPRRKALVAALNGVLGDYLVAIGNPLATPMSLHCRGNVVAVDRPVTIPGASRKVLILVHGLCLHEGHWSSTHAGGVIDYGETLATALGYTPLGLRYNTGLHTSINGRDLSLLLDAMLARWPVPVDELAIVAHSMGGLVVRSACHEATTEGRAWLQKLRHVVFLGTPHHGAPLERAGNRIDWLLEQTRYTAPFAALGRVRSAGITDLRYGHVVDADWVGRDRFRRSPDTRAIVPLPEGVACHAIAATRAGRRSGLADRLIGDGLVPVPSALGEHDDPRRSLGFGHGETMVAYRTNHLQLLGSPQVTRQLIAWLWPSPDRRAGGRRSARRRTSG